MDHTIDKVLVLLSTYNGIRFLDEQIKSVLAQEDVNVTILIRDDGSKDGTQDFINKWVDIYPDNIIFYQGSNKGPARSFLDLLEKSKEFECDYISFCDQDDVWMPSKLIKAINCLKKRFSSKGNLYLGSYQMVDNQLKPIYTPHLKPKIGILEAMIDNVATGCTMVFDKKLASYVSTLKPKFVLMHDDWVYKTAVLMGANIIFDDEKLMLYRQHTNNVIGGIGLNFKDRWSVRFKKFFHPERLRSRVVNELFESYQDTISISTYDVLFKLAHYKRGMNKLFFLFHKRFRGQSLEGTMRAKFMILFNQF